MNIFMNTFAFAIMALICIFFIYNKKLIIKINLAYVLLNVVIVSTILLDILFLDLSLGEANNLFYFVAKLYLIFLVFDSFSITNYSIKVFNNDEKIRKKYFVVALLLFILSIVLIICLPTTYDIDSSGKKYLSGPSLYASYTMSFIFMLFNIFLIYKNRNIINKRSILAVAAYTSLWIFSTGLQVICNYIVLNDNVIYFGRLPSTIGCLTIFALIENPENDTESEFGTLNDIAFRKYIEKNYNKNFVILSLDKNHFKTYDHIKKVLHDVLRNTSSVYRVFKYDQCNFIFTNNPVKNDFYESDIQGLIYNHIQNNSFLHFHIINIKSNIGVESNDKLIKYIDFLISNINFDNKMEIINNQKFDEIKENIKISNSVNYAIKNNKVLVNYQGIYDINEEKFVSAEALVRIVDENNLIIPPYKFIPMIEKDGRIKELADIVLENVCKFISKNNLEKLGLKYIEINLSTKQFNDSNLVYDYTNLVKSYNINPKFINFEITETSNNDINKIVSIMNEFMNYGFRFSLDDFGTGNSNLNYIINMPIDIVKFDKSMVDSYFTDEKTKIIVKETINMIKRLDKKIVFEGVETKEQVEFIKNLDVDFIQGYYYSKPLNEHEFIKLLEINNNLKQE